MSVHLKQGQKPLGKVGKPGSFLLEEIDDTTITNVILEKIISEILDSAESSESTNIEISKKNALVIQYRDYRITITRPPFSDAIEITIVHPIIKLSLDDYGISEKLMNRLTEKAEGILISGPPGSGKSTLASGLANYYHSQNKIVKTFESPRDLQVDEGVTQYTKLDGSFENSADILLLVRPDYTIFDEVRRRQDFHIFSDLRLAGVGMVGVLHANSPIDAVQRFIGKIELGTIPSVIDTVVFVKDGEIKKVYGLRLKVKVPSGMFERDLARPVIEIQDFETQNLEYEIYTFGEENVIIPVSSNNHETAHNVQPTGTPLEFDFAETKTAFLLDIGREYSGNTVDAFVDEKYLSSLRTNRKGHAKILKRSNIGRRLARMAKSKNDIQLHLNNH